MGAMLVARLNEAGAIHGAVDATPGPTGAGYPMPRCRL